MVLVTVGFSVYHGTTQEQKITKLEQDAKQAYGAAEAGIDAALKAGSTVSIGSLGLGQGISGSATVQTNAQGVFSTPILKKDEEYTFYLSDYDVSTNSFTGAAFNSTMSITLASPPSIVCSGAQKMALELTFILTDSTNSNPTIADRRMIDPCLLTNASTGTVSVGQSFTPLPASLLIMRVIAPDGNFSGVSLKVNNGAGNWPLQGKTIVSSAQTATGATKKLQLIQSYPQLPSEFFVTRF